MDVYKWKMSILTSWLSIYTALFLLTVSFPSTTNAEIVSLLGDNDVVVDLYDGPKRQTIHNRIGKKGRDEMGFRAPIPKYMNVQKAHIVYGDENVVCQVWASGYRDDEKSRLFWPTKQRITLRPAVEDARILHCWLSDGTPRSKSRKPDEISEEETGRGSENTLEDVKKAVEEEGPETLREREARRYRMRRWRNRKIDRDR